MSEMLWNDLRSIDLSAGWTDDNKRKIIAIASRYLDVEAARLHLMSMMARITRRVLSVENLRPLPVFLGISPGMGLCLSADAFNPPIRHVDKSAPEKVYGRLRLNLVYFLSNYALVMAMTAIVVALMHPGMLLVLGIIYGIWSFHSYLIRNHLIIIEIPIHSIISVQQRFYLLLVITLFLVYWKCLVPISMVLAISGLLIMGHASLRDPKHVDTGYSGLVNSEDDDDDVESSRRYGGETSTHQTGDEETLGLLDSAVLVDRPMNNAGTTTGSRSDVI